MFELSITNNQNSIFGSSPENKFGFTDKLHEIVSFSNQQIKIGGTRFKGEKYDFCETPAYIIAIVGKVFYRLAYSSNLDLIDSGEILQLYNQEKETFTEHLKGNYNIVIYNKKEESLLVIKDVLGLKYLYYKYEKDYFYISTNLNDFKQITTNINYPAVIEKLLFTYPIGEETYLKGVFLLNEGGRLRIANCRMQKDTYTSIETLFKPEPLQNKFCKKTFLGIFEKTVLQCSGVSSEINVSLTGGFDGRSIIAVLLNHKKKFHSYSFGKQGGENTEVPIMVAGKLGLDYEPIFLDENYEKKYAECALDAICFSDGISTFERANYIYAMQKIANNSHYNITGLIGGELFSPVHLKMDYINSTYYDLVYLGIDYSVDKLLVEKGIKDFIRNEITDNTQTLNKISDNIKKRRELVNKWKSDESGWLYYLKDFMTLGFRQFYGSQMQLERYYSENLSPFYDIDVIEYLFSTSHVVNYKNAFKDSPLLRRNNRKLQTWIIDHFSKALSDLPVDRGYPPVYTTDIRKLLIPIIFYLRRKRLKHSPPEFDSPAWSIIFYTDLIKHIVDFSDELLDKSITIGTMEKYNRSAYNKTFNQMLSIAIWLKL